MREVLEALDGLRTGGFAVGPQWHAAHKLAQDHEGEPVYDWLHAFCHRIEGDDWNAGYWYRRAGKARGEGSLEEEWVVMRATLAGDG
ncbi:hypothetical protein [Oricola sp.]|uniref:hypothetical protein n=1 Tax=Oricola sp. TaxID=1979950 RepID=UPI003BA9C892